MEFRQIGLVGFGEVGKIFAQGLAPRVEALHCWDIKLAAPVSRGETFAQAAMLGVGLCQSAAELCQRSDLVISAVTASSTLEVAAEAARHIRPGTVFLDLNSASPGTKQRAAALIDDAGGSYVEAGVMTSVPPYGIRVPMLLGGEKADALSKVLRGYGMDASPVASTIGVASAIKMCRSVMIKGLEALVIESYATARHYGVEDHMIATLTETFPSIDWHQQGAYFFSRVSQHGKRRAEEMREVANTVREAGFMPWMAAATAEKHDWVAQQSRAGAFDGLSRDATWQAYADLLLARDKGE